MDMATWFSAVYGRGPLALSQLADGVDAPEHHENTTQTPERGSASVPRDGIRSLAIALRNEVSQSQIIGESNTP